MMCVLILAILAALVGWIFYRLESFPARTARQVSAGFAEVLNVQPKVTVNNRVIVEQSKSLIELAVVSRVTQVEHDSESQWLKSTKRVKLRGVYQIKAGFDLAQPFSVRIEGRRVFVEVPPPRILSVDAQSVEVLSLQNGIWNKVSAPELEAELRGLPILARQKASEAGLQKEALEMITARLREKFGTQFDIEVRVSGKRELMTEGAAP
ncbi:MAG: hypothetical protein JWL59_5131 [Chthoniobacteraceae bacterium]|nr:hypothetical protein [Chthoniobacteraceae bacterium]